jgi:asparagine synthase (glutamine-hydrolysing)
MTGICGWFGVCEGDASRILADMSQRITWDDPAGRRSEVGPGFALAAVGAPDTIGVFAFGPLRVAFHGHGHWREGPNRALTPAAFCERFADAYRQRGADALGAAGGDFALAVIDLEANRALLAIDRAGVRNLVYRDSGGLLAFASNLDSLGVHPSVVHRVDPQALYNYVYFHMVPGPGTIFAGSHRLLPGHCVVATREGAQTRRYWAMRFIEDQRSDSASLKREFRETLVTGVETFARDACGTFLSGGTDSSTVTGVLSGLSTAPIDSFSIGFDASGYDEMEYARIAAKRFVTHHHEYYVTPADVVAALPLVAAEYDQPFGNASAVPTYHCARFAKSKGVTRLLAGDGGDELFGGNVRYARQYQFALYERIPQAFRSRLIEPILDSAFSKSIPFLRKGRSYVTQARLPMPARYETYNLLERLGPAEVFHGDFLAGVDRGRPLAMLTERYREADADSLINRMLDLDLKFTLADNDLPKVTQMCARAGVDVAFPLLHDSLVAFSSKLAPDLKLRRTRLRYFFKEALRDFLPREIVEKSKHGFGLPVGPWLVEHHQLRELAGDALASLRKRGIFSPRFLDGLLGSQLREHPGYYGTMVWVLMMLELWFQHHQGPPGSRHQ